MPRLICFVIAGLTTGATAGRAQFAERMKTVADRELVTALVAIEDSRDSTMSPSDPRRRGLASQSRYIRAFTVRGLGRIETGSLIPAIAPALDDTAAEVRSAAADALAQAASAPVLGSPASTDARALLTKRLQVERDPAVRAALLEAIGRLSQGGSVAQVEATANVVAPWLSSLSPVERRGAIRGMFFLSQKREARAPGVIPNEVTDRVFAMLTEKSPADYSATERANLAAILVSAAAMNDARILAMFAHADPFIRDPAVGALTRSADTSMVRSILALAMGDPVPIVRFRSIGVYSRRLRAIDGCSPLIRLARDRDMTVALAAVDALSGCRSDMVAVAFLDSLAGTFRNGDAWHLPTHAFVALATADPPRAHEMMPIFAMAQSYFVRMYADTVARVMKDTAALYRLARDTQPNVRASAIKGLSLLVGHAADSIYRAALLSDDNQLLMAAAAALEKSPDTAATKQAVLDAWTRIVRSGRETSRDGRIALIERMTELNVAMDPSAVRPFTQVPTPTFSDLAVIEQTVATIEMVDGAVIRVRFHPFDAPTNAARFVHLARAGTFDGLTFHRVAPFFVVQGPSPNGNEYSAPDRPFTRDELGLENLRGSVGLSTRGRDTGDGQIFINTVDNTRLDHDYTVMATIVSGLEAFDRMQEGARVKQITVAQIGGH
jgi:cyclophilin family peptidyl-prolyl cis-trans isomerase/HEAT repeat protein